MQPEVEVEVEVEVVEVEVEVVVVLLLQADPGDATAAGRGDIGTAAAIDSCMVDAMSLKCLK